MCLLTKRARVPWCMECALEVANVPPARQTGTRFTYPRGTEGWVDLSGWLSDEIVCCLHSLSKKKTEIIEFVTTYSNIDRIRKSDVVMSEIPQSSIRVVTGFSTRQLTLIRHNHCTTHHTNCNCLSKTIFFYFFPTKFRKMKKNKFLDAKSVALTAATCCVV